VIKRIAIVSVLGLAACLAPASSWASDFRAIGPATSTSVFPVPRDPWRSWGVQRDPPLRQTLPRHVASPRGRAPVVDSEPVWVPAQWTWDGAAWVWWPGGWVR
jgi:hypothetical protein